MSIVAYKAMQNSTDNPVQLSIRAVRSILLYCQDCSNKELSTDQRKQSALAGKVLCETIVTVMRDDLPFEEQRVLTTIFTRIAEALYKYEIGESCSLFEHERALNKILDVLTK